MALQDLHRHLGATLAPDGIPLHYGDQKAEFHAALHAAALMERSHEGRLELSGRDRLSLLQRISTNDVLALSLGEGRPTIFTNPNARIIDRITVYHRGDTVLALTEPGRGEAVRVYLQRNIFFNDDARLTDLTPATRQFALHGPRAVAVFDALKLPVLEPMHGVEFNVGGAPVFVARNKPISGDHYILVVANAHAETVWSTLLAVGASAGLVPAGSLTYNALRIRAGRPGVGRELSAEYLPLEVGLWDEVNFRKGCYTGQEIIARMESRNRLARTIVSLRLEGWVEAPASLTHEGREVGTLTSSVTTPDGDILGIGIVKVAAAQPGVALAAGAAGVPATITLLPGVQPPMISAAQPAAE
jgi:tRNA-modifying protein YgfZ